MSVAAINYVFALPIKSSAQKLLLLAVANRISDDSGRCFPGQALLATECTMSERQVREHLLAMEHAGLIIRYYRHNGNGGRTSDEYEIVGFLNWLKQSNGSAKDFVTGGFPPVAERGVGNRRKRVLVTGGNPPGNPKKNPKRNPQSLSSASRDDDMQVAFGFEAEKSAPASPIEIGDVAKKQGSAGATAYTADFEAFWNSYPRKDAKAAAFKAWRKLSADLRTRAMSGLQVHLGFLTSKANDENGNFCPQGSTWLRGHRFDDPAPAPPLPARSKPRFQTDEDRDAAYIERLMAREGLGQVAYA